MSLTLTSEKREKNLESCKSFLKRDSFKIRELSSLIGTLISTFPGNTFRPLNYRQLDKCKTLGLRKAKGKFDTRIKLTEKAILDLQWWIKICIQCQKSYSTQILQKLFTLMHQCMGGEHTVKECQQEDHGLTQQRIVT